MCLLRILLGGIDSECTLGTLPPAANWLVLSSAHPVPSCDRTLSKTYQNGKAPIHLAAAPSSYDAVRAEHVPAIALEALLEMHANPVARDAHGNTPLMDAVLGGYLEVVKRLLQIANVPADDKNKVSLTGR